MLKGFLARLMTRVGREDRARVVEALAHIDRRMTLWREAEAHHQKEGNAQAAAVCYARLNELALLRNLIA